MTKTVSGTTTIEARYGYDPYGVATKLQGSLDADFQYAGYYMHEPSGLNLPVFRAYSSSLGRFINRDPIGEDGGVNLYGYVGENPIGSMDPWGLYDYAIELYVEYANHNRNTINDGIAATGHTAYRMISNDPSVGSTDITGLRPQSGWSAEKPGWAWDVATGFRLSKKQYESGLKSFPSETFDVSKGKQCTTGALSKARSSGMNIMPGLDKPSVFGMSTPPQETPHSLGNFLENLNRARTLQWNAIQKGTIKIPPELRIPGYTIAPGKVER